MRGSRISRRTVLRGLGTAMALPALEAMLPRHAFAAESAAELASASGSPLRMAFLYVPNGMNMQQWTPQDEGTSYELPQTLTPLADHRNEIAILSGLTHRRAFANGDGGGDHARALTTFLTGMQARKTDGADIRAGVSVDQVAAQEIGIRTRFPSLEMGAEQGAQSGGCDSGYSCAYSSNIAWKSATQPLPKENNPRMIFDRLFSNGRPGETEVARLRRERAEQSLLDFVQEDVRQLNQQLGTTDRRKLDEYLTAVRELERRLQRSSQAPEIDATAPEGIPDNYEEHLRLLADLMVLAFQTDSTRISTLVLANEGSNKSYNFIDVPEGHHDLSHHENQAEKLAKIQQINEFHVRQFAYLLDRMKSVQEGEGTLLDQSMIIYGSGIGDGNAHNHDNLPIVMAGRAGGQIRTGRHIVFPDQTPLTNLYLTMLDWMDVSCERLGDSTGPLTGLA